MKNRSLYIIPGYKETPKRKPYKQIAEIAAKRGYKIFKVNVNWSKSLSKQIFNIEKGDVLFAFSLGGILAQLVASKSNISKMILASPTTYLCANDFKNKLPRGIINDIRKTKDIKLKNYVCFYGELEKEYIPKYVPKNMKFKIIPKTGHNLSNAYIKEITGRL